MDKQAIFQHFTSILNDALASNMCLRSYFMNPYSLEDSIECGNGVEIASGVTRGAIIDDNYDWVVKFELNEDHADGLCDKEVEVWEAAKEQNLEDCFAEVAYIGTYEVTMDAYQTWGEYWECDEDEFLEMMAKYEYKIAPTTISIPLWAARKAKCGSITGNEPTPEEKTRMRTHESPLAKTSELVGVIFLRECGQETYDKLTQFCVEHRINDLHRGNVGIIDGKTVFIDYAGYHENDYDDDSEDSEETDW